MTDPLFGRARLAIEENHRLREQRRLIEDTRDEQLSDLRRTRLESAMYRSEIKAHRDNRE